MAEKVRVGAGAGYAGDRWAPAVELAEEYASKIAGSGTSASRINPAERYMGGFVAAIDYEKKVQE